MLNDFIFCPYSIYLHNVYQGGDDELTHSVPQTQGKETHAALDEKRYSTKQENISALTVYSEELGLIGKIDLYKGGEKILIDRKHHISTIYLGQKYQLWAYYFAMIEMGFEINKIAFYSMSDNTTIPIEVPSSDDKIELSNFIKQMKDFNPDSEIPVNVNKCLHCVYSNLCDKMELENVYS